ncbi:MAG: hypothetical protein SW127_16470 [Actinomycetota bacterium]|nr:hypothetical protein [Actinomycetota bacterium]
MTKIEPGRRERAAPGEPSTPDEQPSVPNDFGRTGRPGSARGRGEVRPAVVHGVTTLAIALIVVIVAGATDGAVETTLVVLAPLVVLVGALTALWRTYRSWRSGGRWQIWQGAAWFLLAMFIFFLSGVGPVITS